MSICFFTVSARPFNMTFSTREEAGSRLGQYLLEHGVRTEVVAGLPRGGVVVAAEVARVLQQPLDVIVVRKIGHPQYREFAVGALAEANVVFLDEAALAGTKVDRPDLEKVIAEETARLRAHEDRFHQFGHRDFSGKVVLIVDDGLATGTTTEAAIVSARKQMAREVLVAAPVASQQAVERLRPITDGIFVLLEDPDFMAVGQYYSAFPQTTDDEVTALLQDHNLPQAQV
jgi:putative phosphoribosyl transferase